MSDSPFPFESEVLTLGQALRSKAWRLVTAESCTGGLIAAACTSVAGSSDWFERGFVTYSNAAKTDLLGVPASLIAAHGAVSAEVALAMAQGALAQSAGHAQCAVAVTGIAGPGGGSSDKPVGTVWLALAWAAARQGVATEVTLLHLQGDRRLIREQTVQRALAGLMALARRG